MNRPVWTDDETRRMHAMKRNGVSNRDIAAALDKSVRGVERKCHRDGLRRPRIVKPKTPVTPRERQQRLTTVIVRIHAPVPSGAVLGDVVVIAGRELAVVGYSPDGELVTADRMTREIVVVAE